MANLYYGGDPAPIEVPDLLLAHVKVVVATKLRRRESFMLSWRPARDAGLASIWVQPSIPMRFVFEGAESPEIDRMLLADLADAANSNRGIILNFDESGGGERILGGVGPRGSVAEAAAAA